MAAKIIMRQEQLFPNSRQVAGLLCLQCPLEICDESDPGCLYVRAESRKDYYREHYQANREKKIAAAKERNKTPEYRLYQIEYQREYRRQGRDK